MARLYGCELARHASLARGRVPKGRGVATPHVWRAAQQLKPRSRVVPWVGESSQAFAGVPHEAEVAEERVGKIELGLGEVKGLDVGGRVHEGPEEAHAPDRHGRVNVVVADAGAALAVGLAGVPVSGLPCHPPPWPHEGGVVLLHGEGGNGEARARSQRGVHSR